MALELQGVETQYDQPLQLLGIELQYDFSFQIIGIELLVDTSPYNEEGPPYDSPC